LTDFGLAVHLDEPKVLTLEGATVGTFDYLSPEQARVPHGIDIRSDIYSLGCSCYHMIAGVVPFPDPTTAGKLMAHREVEPDPLPILAPSCPPGLAVVVRRMMRKSRAQRYARPSEVASALEPFASGRGPLSRIVAMEMGSRDAAASAADGAYTVEWFDSDSEMVGSLSGDEPGPRPHEDMQDVFPRVDDEMGFPLPATPPPDAPERGPRWWRGPWPFR
jgi:serine/threonine-protein kinase